MTTVPTNAGYPVWLTELPEGWRLGRVRDHVTLVNGFPFPSSRFSMERGHRLVRIRDLLGDLDVVYVDTEWYEPAAVSDGDVVVGMDGDFNVVQWDRGPALLNQRLCLLRAKGGLHQRFLYYALPTPLRIVNELTYFTTVKHLSSSTVLDVKIPLPPTPLQASIADFLDRETSRIDSLIAKKEQLICLLEEHRLSVAARVVLRGLDPDAPTIDSGIPSIGAVPAHWRIVRNKNILRAVQEPSPDGSEELLSVSHITGVTPRSEKEVTMILAESNVGYPRVAPGDLVINTMWAWMGALGVARHHGIVSPAYGVYRFTDAGLLPEYYDAFYRTAAYVTEMTRFSTGVWSSRLRIYPDVFLSLRVVVPPIKEQREILDHIKTATGGTKAVLDRLAASVALLREKRQALITAAVAGQIDVRDEVAA